MIHWILIFSGIIATIIGVFGLFSLFVWLPIKEKFEIVYDREIEFIHSRLDPKIQMFVAYNTKQLTNFFIVCCLMGPFLFFSGYYLGYAAKGEGFWLYRKLYPEVVNNQVWDEINEKGQFVAEDGKAYTHYILISGDEISLSGEPCADIQELKERLSQIRMENTVIMIDSFATASAYHSAENVLNELGIQYEETR